jgi:hypothetical protein
MHTLELNYDKVFRKCLLTNTWHCAGLVYQILKTTGADIPAALSELTNQLNRLPAGNSSFLYS